MPSQDHLLVISQVWSYGNNQMVKRRAEADTNLIILGFRLHQTVEEEGGAAEEETDQPADTDGHLGVELRPQHLRAHREYDGQVPESDDSQCQF